VILTSAHKLKYFFNTL